MLSILSLLEITLRTSLRISNNSAFLRRWHHTPPLRGTEPGPNSRESLSHQLKKRGSQDVRDIYKTETMPYHDSIDDPWCPSDRSWTKESWGDVFEVLSISEPGRDVSQSQ